MICRLGLTGSIGMGKSTAAGFFAEAGLPVVDADSIVHGLYARGGTAVAPVDGAFPGVADADGIDRAKLAALLLAAPHRYAELEAIVHPLVRAAQERAVTAAAGAGAAVIVLDIPLLFETGRQAEMDLVITVSAPAALQRTRVLARPGMTVEKFESIIARQMPDAEKRARSDTVIDSGQPLDAMRADVGFLAARGLEGAFHARNRP